jgi:hypothetical protein
MSCNLTRTPKSEMTIFKEESIDDIEIGPF